MNAPFRPPSAPVSLDDKYASPRGPVFLNGTQALVRLTMLQAERDRAAGLNTAGFVTGYRGSPLGAVDSAFAGARRHWESLGVRFHHGLNEDLAATSIIGTQQVGLYGPARVDGVFALWYGKGPGVDRAGDAIHHGNAYGAAAKGGVLLAAGDDHLAKSSTTAHQSEYALAASLVPTLHPATLDEILDYGLLGWAMSRFTGLWVGLKLVTDLVDSAGVVDIDPARARAVLPSIDLPPGGLNISAAFAPHEQERVLHLHRLPAAHAFARANGLDRVTLASPRPRLGIVATGKSWRDVGQALSDLGLSPERAAALGVTVYKVGMAWPLERDAVAAFARGLEELMVVEEKRPLIEDQVKAALYDLPDGRHPRVIGKRDAENAQLLPTHGELTPLAVARAIAARLLPHVDDPELLARWARLGGVDPSALAGLSPVKRAPFFCSGCPHNSSTVVPEGSRAVAGIGCHGMVQHMNRNTDVFTQMGGEGANWIGQAPFVETPHVFQNLGDGTYFHSGLLAIRAAIAAGVNITYKILFNDAVAMTGGQPVDGVLTPQAISAQVAAEGVGRIAVVTDDPDKYDGQPAFAAGATIHHRRDLDAVQRSLRDVPGATVLIYDQMCATEKRRRRKRGTLAEGEKRVLINDLVCEGCGDCSVKSNCLSVAPLDTEWGTKRRIDQSSCNTDLSCVRGFCPSFVTVGGAKPRKPQAADLGRFDGVALPDPEPAAPGRAASVLVTGIGGTGVVTIGAVLAMAAHLDGRAAGTLDMTGLAQKGGQVFTHLKIAGDPKAILSNKIGPEGADLVIGADIVGAASADALAATAPGRTRVLLNDDEAVTGAFIGQPDFRLPGRQLRRTVEGRAGAPQVSVVSATALARRWLGDAIGANTLLMGYAWQRGWLPLSEGAIRRAIELNGTAVAMNLAAFRLGRIAAAAPDLVAEPAPRAPATLDELVERRVAFLTDYQDAAYAERYRLFLDDVRARERAVMGRDGALADAVARGLFRLMAYKDEYEVGRLWSDPSFARTLRDAFEPGARLEYHLAPPLLARRDPVTGEPQKIRFGPWMRHGFALLARLKRLRGTPFDPFGHTAERRGERALVDRYRALVDRLLDGLMPEGHARAVKLADAANRIRGYGHVKARNIARVEEEWRVGAAEEPRALATAA